MALPLHKEIDGRFLQLYLNEYCWKFNRRFFRDSNDPKYFFQFFYCFVFFCYLCTRNS